MGWVEQPREELARPETFRAVRSDAGQAGWYRERKALDEGKALDKVLQEEQLAAVNAQRALANDRGRWVPVLDAEKTHDGTFTVYQPQDFSLHWVIRTRQVPGPEELAKFAAGVVNALIQLRDKYRPSFGGLRPQNVFFPTNDSGKPDLSRPLLCQIPANSALTSLLSHETDAHALGLVLHDLVRQPEHYTDRHQRWLPDGGARFWPTGNRKVDTAWRRFVGDLLEGKHDEESLEKLKEAIPKPPKGPSWVKILIAAVPCIVLILTLIFHIPPIPPPIPPVPPNTNTPNTPTNTPIPPPPPKPCLLTSTTLQELKQLAAMTEFPSKLKSAISKLPDDCVAAGDDFDSFSSAVADWWKNDVASLNADDVAKSAPPLSVSNLLTQPYVPDRAPEVGNNSELAERLRRETTSRKSHLDQRRDLFVSWTNARATALSKLPESEGSGWHKLGVGTEVNSLAAREFVSYVSAHPPDPSFSGDPVYWKSHLDNISWRIPTAFFLANGLASNIMNFLQEAEVKDRITNDLREALKRDSKALAQWQTNTSATISQCAPVTFTFPGFSPDPQTLKAEMRSALNLADICLVNGLSVGESRSKLEGCLATWTKVSGQAASGGFRHATLQSQYQGLYPDYQKATNTLARRLNERVTSAREDFENQATPDFKSAISKLEPIKDLPPITDIAPPLIADLRRAEQDWNQANSALDNCDYPSLLAAVKRWTPLETGQAGFKSLSDKGNQESAEYNAILDAIKRKNYPEATNQWARLNLQVAEKACFKALYDRFPKPEIILKPPPIVSTPIVPTPLTNETVPKPPVTNQPVATATNDITPDGALNLVRRFALQGNWNVREFTNWWQYEPKTSPDAINYANRLLTFLKDRRTRAGLPPSRAQDLAKHAVAQVQYGLNVREDEAKRIMRQVQTTADAYLNDQ